MSAEANVAVSAEVEVRTAGSNAVLGFSGNPSDTEIAAITAVLAASAHATASPAARDILDSPMSSLGGWGDPADQLRYGLSAASAHFVHAHFSR